MIKIEYERGSHRVTVEGHAKSAEKGKDLVCCAVSTLCCTLAANAERIATFHEMARRPSIVLEDGHADIKCDAVHGYDDVVTLMFDTVCTGFEMMAANYPDYVSFALLG